MVFDLVLLPIENQLNYHLPMFDKERRLQNYNLMVIETLLLIDE
jgi:hypothetical protein